jgi:hypothetical protein
VLMVGVAVTLMNDREISHRGLTRQQKVDIACRQLPKDPPATVVLFCLRLLADQFPSLTLTPTPIPNHIGQILSASLWRSVER